MRRSLVVAIVLVGVLVAVVVLILILWVPMGDSFEVIQPRVEVAQADVHRAHLLDRRVQRRDLPVLGLDVYDQPGQLSLDGGKATGVSPGVPLIHCYGDRRNRCHTPPKQRTPDQPPSLPVNAHPQPPIARRDPSAHPCDLSAGLPRSRPSPPPSLLLPLVAVDHRDSDVGTRFTRQFALGTREQRAEGTDVPPDVTAILTGPACTLCAGPIVMLLPVHAVHAIHRYII